MSYRCHPIHRELLSAIPLLTIPRYGKPYYPKTYSKWIADATEIVPESKLLIDAPVKVDVMFAIPRSKTSKLIVPVGDGDNYEHLYLDTEANLLRVSMKGGLLMDPRADPNPATSVEVAGAVKP